MNSQENTKINIEKATFGAGCFWCVEAIFDSLDGVIDVVSGYTGGQTKNPSYKEVCTGITGHAEVIQITYNPSIINFNNLLELFWKVHDPTTLNQQGSDVGSQYRSVIFYHNDLQRELALQSFKNIDQSDYFKNSIVTEISPLSDFYIAEDYHQNYYRLNSNAPYCKTVIKPKLDKIFK